MKLDHAHAVLHQPLHQRRAIFRRHHEIVVAERLQPELHAADDRPIVPSTGGGVPLLDSGGTRSAEFEKAGRRAHNGNSPEFATRHTASIYH